MDGIPYENRMDKAHMVISIGKSSRINQVGSHAHCNGEGECAVGDTFSEFSGFCKFRIHMVGKEVSCLTGMKDNVRFCNGASNGFADASYFIFFKINVDSPCNIYIDCYAVL